jgi:hypothetical protein
VPLQAKCIHGRRRSCMAISGAEHPRRNQCDTQFTSGRQGFALGSARSFGGVRLYPLPREPGPWLCGPSFRGVCVYGSHSSISREAAASRACCPEWAAGLHQSFVEESAVGRSCSGRVGRKRNSLLDGSPRYSPG